MRDRTDHHTDTDTLRLPPPPAPQPPVPPYGAPAARSDSKRPRGAGWKPVAAAALVAALVSGGVTGGVLLADDDAATEPAAVAPAEPAAAGVQPDADETTVEAVAEAVSPSVAQVNVLGPRGEGSGSAVVYRADGYLLTNNHVVEGAQQAEVVLPDGSALDAEVVGTDPFSDLAVLKVEATDLPVPPYSTATPNVGETAVAIGSPFGLDGSVTAGIVSALNREVAAGNVQLVGMIQTDAAINPGNSGGALVNGDGEVIGINTAILSRTGANNGIGFAIPISAAQPIADQLIEHGSVEHAQLGVEGQNIDPRVAELYGLGVEQGAVVTAVLPGSAADEAGLQRGDIIVALDGQEIDSFTTLAGYIRGRYRPGDAIDITYVRGGEEQTVEVTLGTADALPQQR